jgi:hypothetical protein
MEEKMPVVIGQPAFRREFDKPLAAAQAPPAPPVMVSQARRKPQMGMEEVPAVQAQTSVSAIKNSIRKPRVGNV